VDYNWRNLTQAESIIIDTRTHRYTCMDRVLHSKMKVEQISDSSTGTRQCALCSRWTRSSRWTRFSLYSIIIRRRTRRAVCLYNQLSTYTRYNFEVYVTGTSCMYFKCNFLRIAIVPPLRSTNNSGGACRIMSITLPFSHFVPVRSGRMRIGRWNERAADRAIDSQRVHAIASDTQGATFCEALIKTYFTIVTCRPVGCN
jgi:hypothetical protein